MGIRSSRMLVCVLLLLTVAAFLVLVSGAPAESLTTTPGPLVDAALQQAQLTQSDGAAGDYYGCSVAISGDVALVGASYQDVGGDVDAGAVYVFIRSGGTWTQQTELTASDEEAGDNFGSAVAFDGTTAIIGASNKSVTSVPTQGVAYVFTYASGSWTERKELSPSYQVASEHFGSSVALSGGTALIGSPNQEVGGNSGVGAVYVFTGSGADWTQQGGALTASDLEASNQFGGSVALDGDTALVGAAYHTVDTVQEGVAYVFTRTGSNWTQQQELLAADGTGNDNFGSSVALQGDTMLIGARNKTVGATSGQGATYVFTRAGGIWTQQTELTASDGAAGDYFGSSVALKGSTALVGAPYVQVGTNAVQGAAYMFTGGGASWAQQARLTASVGAAWDFLGSSVALDRSTAIVGGTGMGSWPPLPATPGVAYAFLLPCTVTPSVTGGHGTITPATAQTYDQGATPTFTFTPDAGYAVGRVLVDARAVTPTTATSYTFPALTADHTISVEFAVAVAVAKYTVTPSVVGSHGTISPATAQSYDQGATPSFTFAPNAGYVVGTVSVDGSPVQPTTATSYSFPALGADHAIAVSFRHGGRTPRIVGLSRRAGHHGAVLTIRGRRFGKTRGTSVVRFGHVKARRYLSWNAKKIRVRVPWRALTGKRRVRVTTAAGTSRPRWFRVRK
jgi:hypothetical protein